MEITQSNISLAVDGETATQRGQEICLRSHSKLPFGFLLTAGAAQKEHGTRSLETRLRTSLLHLLTAWPGAGDPSGPQFVHV